MWTLDAEQAGATYKVDPEDPVVIYKNGGFGFNFKNRKLVDKMFASMKAAGEYTGDMEPQLKESK